MKRSHVYSFGLFIGRRRGYCPTPTAAVGRVGDEYDIRLTNMIDWAALFIFTIPSVAGVVGVLLLLPILNDQ